MGKWSNQSGSFHRWTVAAMLAAAGAGLSAARAQQPGSPQLQNPPGKPETPPAESPTKTAGFADAAPDAVAEVAPDPDIPSIRIGAFVLRYPVPHAEFPALDDLMKASVTLGQTGDGFVKPGGGVPTATYTIEELSSQPAQNYTWGAATLVARAVQLELFRQGIVGVQVFPSEDEIAEEAGEDGKPVYVSIRPAGKTALTLNISAAVVNQVRSVAFGNAVPYAQRIDNPRYQRIVDNSPVQPFDPDDEQRDDLLRKDLLDDYVFRLNRHPGRRVDLGIAAADQDNALVLDYYINENRPWFVYFQASNTGTKETNEWRERFGLAHNQLTNSDDILSIDYVTAGFDASHSVNVSYDRPLWGDWLRGKLLASYSEFTASDVGAANQNFQGDSWFVGGELVANFLQQRDWFMDAYVGGRWQNISIEGDAGGSVTNPGATEDFFIGNFGVRAEHVTDIETISADVGFLVDLPGIAGTDTGNVEDNFQRQNADSDWLVFQFDANYSFFLEPILIPTRWRNSDISKFASGEASPTLAHEMALGLRGQHAFGDRLIPNFQQVAGGLYTVRGYPESVSAGDSVVIGSLEYRFHLPQALGFEDPTTTIFGEPFRRKPQSAYGRADWDFILKGFLDAGATVNSGRQTGESDDTLVGTGVGAELSFRRNFSLRVDWGVALKDIEDEVTAGSNRFHISVTILF